MFLTFLRKEFFLIAGAMIQGSFIFMGYFSVTGTWNNDNSIGMFIYNDAFIHIKTYQWVVNWYIWLHDHYSLYFIGMIKKMIFHPKRITCLHWARAVGSTRYVIRTQWFPLIVSALENTSDSLSHRTWRQMRQKITRTTASRWQGDGLFLQEALDVQGREWQTFVILSEKDLRPTKNS